MQRVHIGLAIFWILMGIPTFLWWGNSVMWVNVMSLYALVLGHLAGYGGARAERKVEKMEEKGEAQ
jgi:uncharacterized membrane protein